MGIFSKLFPQKETCDINAIYAPMDGRAVPICEVEDPTFAEGLLGQGVAIQPTDGRVYAPCDGVVDTMFDTGHAVSITADNGAEILIHVGLETVILKGRCFRTYVKSGQRIRRGQLLFEANLAGIRAAGLDTITPILICNAEDYPALSMHTGAAVTNQDAIMLLR